MEEQLLHDINLIGLKYNNLDIPYFNLLPETFIICTDFMNFFKLQKGKRKVTKENLERIEGMEYIVYSLSSKLYYYKIIHELTNMFLIHKYFKDGNVYVYAPTIQKEKLKILDPEPLETELKQSNEEDLIY
jgi:hypothetical protein